MYLLSTPSEIIQSSNKSLVEQGNFLGKKMLISHSQTAKQLVSNSTISQYTIMVTSCTLFLQVLRHPHCITFTTSPHMLIIPHKLPKQDRQDITFWRIFRCYLPSAHTLSSKCLSGEMHAYAVGTGWTKEKKTFWPKALFLNNFETIHLEMPKKLGTFSNW